MAGAVVSSEAREDMAEIWSSHRRGQRGRRRQGNRFISRAVHDACRKPDGGAESSRAAPQHSQRSWQLHALLLPSGGRRRDCPGDSRRAGHHDAVLGGKRSCIRTEPGGHATIWCGPLGDPRAHGGGAAGVAIRTTGFVSADGLMGFPTIERLPTTGATAPRPRARSPGRWACSSGGPLKPREGSASGRSGRRSRASTCSPRRSPCRA